MSKEKQRRVLPLLPSKGGEGRGEEGRPAYDLTWRSALRSSSLWSVSALAGRHVYGCRITGDPSSVTSDMETEHAAPLGLCFISQSFTINMPLLTELSRQLCLSSLLHL